MKKNKSIEFKGNVATLSTLTVSLRSNKVEELAKDLRALCSARCLGPCRPGRRARLAGAG
jgi:hypothetical protein